MPLNFNPPDEIIREYMKRKRPGELASEGLGNAVNTYAGMKEQEKIDAFRQQRLEMQRRGQNIQGAQIGYDPENPAAFWEQYSANQQANAALKNSQIQENIAQGGAYDRMGRGPKPSAASGASPSSATAATPVPKGKMLPPNTVLTLNEGKAVARLLPDVEAAITANEGKYGPVTGRIASANPYNEDAQTFQARMRTASQSFGRFMEGGVLRKEDEIKYLKMFPQASDTDQVKKNKLAIVRRTLAQKYEDDKATLGASGYDVSGFGSLDIPPSLFEGVGGMGSAKKARLEELRRKKAEGTLR